MLPCAVKIAHNSVYPLPQSLPCNFLLNSFPSNTSAKFARNPIPYNTYAKTGGCPLFLRQTFRFYLKCRRADIFHLPRSLSFSASYSLAHGLRLMAHSFFLTPFPPVSSANPGGTPLLSQSSPLLRGTPVSRVTSFSGSPLPFTSPWYPPPIAPPGRQYHSGNVSRQPQGTRAAGNAVVFTGAAHGHD